MANKKRKNVSLILLLFMFSYVSVFSLEIVKENTIPAYYWGTFDNHYENIFSELLPGKIFIHSSSYLAGFGTWMASAHMLTSFDKHTLDFDASFTLHHEQPAHRIIHQCISKDTLISLGCQMVYGTGTRWYQISKQYSLITDDGFLPLFINTENPDSIIVDLELFPDKDFLELTTDSLFPYGHYQYDIETNKLYTTGIDWDKRLFHIGIEFSKDTVIFDTLLYESVLNGLPDLDMSNEERFNTINCYTLENTNTLIVSSVTDKYVLEIYGLLFIKVARDGTILNKKYVKTNIDSSTKRLFKSYWFQDGYFHTLAQSYTGYTSIVLKNGFHQKYTCNGELVEDNVVDFFKTPIQQKKYNTTSFTGRVIDGNLYIRGFVQNNAEKAKFYLAKYDSSYNLMSEKEWQYTDDHSCTTRDIIVEKDTIYLLGLAFYQVNTYVDPIKELYVAKIFDDTYTHVKDIESRTYQEMLIYPNPAIQRNVTADIMYGYDLSYLDIGLYNLLGQKVLDLNKNYEYNDAKHSIFLTFKVPNEIQSGIYLLNVSNGREHITQAIIIGH